MEPKNRTQQPVFIKYVKSLIPQKKKRVKIISFLLRLMIFVIMQLRYFLEQKQNK